MIAILFVSLFLLIGFGFSIWSAMGISGAFYILLRGDVSLRVMASQMVGGIDSTTVTVLADRALARPILGTRESITSMSRDVIHGYWARRYSPRSVVVAIAGNLPDDVIDLVKSHFGFWAGGGVDRGLTSPAVEPNVRVRTKDTEQAHIVFGTPSITRADERRFAGLAVEWTP